MARSLIPCSCVIHDGALECWGDEEFQNNGKREGQFSAVECGSWHTCALDAEGIATCFGAGYALQSTVPAIPLKTVSAGFSDTCGIATGDGSIVCWGMKAEQDLKPPEGRFVQVSVGTRSACAISAHDGAVQCWGSDEFQQMSGAPQTTGFRSVSCGGGHTCALTKGGRLVCWGGSDEYRLGRGIPNTKTPHAQISAGEDHACALGQDGIVRCWGRCKQGACDPPASGKGSKGGRHVEYVAVAAGGLHTCAVRKEDGAIDCWVSSRLFLLLSRERAKMCVCERECVCLLCVRTRVHEFVHRYRCTCVCVYVWVCMCVCVRARAAGRPPCDRWCLFAASSSLHALDPRTPYDSPGRRAHFCFRRQASDPPSSWGSHQGQCRQRESWRGGRGGELA